MPIQTRQELNERLEEVCTGIQEISDYLNVTPAAEALIRFPRGFLRTCGQHRLDYTQITQEHMRSNIAYTLMTIEVIDWLDKRTDLVGQPMAMLYKVSIVLWTSIIECLVRFHQRNVVWPRRVRNRVTYEIRVNRLIECAAISADFAQELMWAWDKRNNVHLHHIQSREFLGYSAADVARVKTACVSLKVALAQHQGAF